MMHNAPAQTVTYIADQVNLTNVVFNTAEARPERSNAQWQDDKLTASKPNTSATITSSTTALHSRSDKHRFSIANLDNDDGYENGAKGKSPQAAVLDARE